MRRFVASVMLLTLTSVTTTALADGDVATPVATPTPAPRAPATVATVATVARPAVAAAVPSAPTVAAPAVVAPTPAAAPAAPAPAVETADAPAGTPLTTRSTKPLTLAPTNEGTPFGYKFIAFLGVATAAGLWLRKRYGVKTSPRVRARIDVLGRTSVGVRSDLLVVDVEGTRLLLGITPSAIQTLAVLEMPEALAEQPVDLAEAVEARRAELAAAMEEEPDAPMPAIARSHRPTPLMAGAAAPIAELGDRVRSLLAPRRGIAAREQPASVPPPSLATAGRRRAAAPKRARVAGQAKGLLLALEPAPKAKANETKDEPEREPIRLGDW